MRIRNLLLFLTIAGASACAAGPRKSAEELSLAARDYHDALQYGDFQVIARYLPPDQRTEWLARAFGMEKTLSVLEFRTISVDVAPAGDRARMATRLSWYELPSTVVKTENVFIDWLRTGGDATSDGAWSIERISGGPLPVEKPEAEVEAAH